MRLLFNIKHNVLPEIENNLNGMVIVNMEVIEKGE